MSLLALVWLLGVQPGLQFDWQLRAQEQVRVGNSYTPGVSQANTLSIAEIASPGARVHLTTRSLAQDLAIEYQPRFLNTYRLTLGGGGGAWAGWTQLHRVLATYRIGDEQQLLALVTGRLVAGQLDLTQPDGLVPDSGFLPGALGQTLSYINGNLALQLTHRLSQHLRLSTTEQIGITQYPTQAATGYFDSMPGLAQSGNTTGNEKQLRFSALVEGEYIINGRTSLFADLTFADVSYQETASYLSLMPSVGLGGRVSGNGRLRLNAGVLKYWTNPMPGIVDKPRYLAVADVTFDRSWADLGAPRLSTHMVARIAPYYNLQFSDIEPRATLQLRFDYKASRGLSFNVGARLLSSQYWNFKSFNHLQRGHPKNIFMAQAGLRYSWRDMIIATVSVFGTMQTFQASSTLPYTELDQIYALVGLQGAWPRPRRPEPQES